MRINEEEKEGRNSVEPRLSVEPRNSAVDISAEDKAQLEKFGNSAMKKSVQRKTGNKGGMY